MSCFRVEGSAFTPTSPLPALQGPGVPGRPQLQSPLAHHRGRGAAGSEQCLHFEEAGDRSDKWGDHMPELECELGSVTVWCGCGHECGGVACAVGVVSGDVGVALSMVGGTMSFVGGACL